MKKLFDIDLKNYDPSWSESPRPSARAIILPDLSKAERDALIARMQSSGSCGALSPGCGTAAITQTAVQGSRRIVMCYSNKYGYYKFPGGGIHEGEKKETALIREVAEETGLSVVPESIREWGVVGRRQRSNHLENTIFVQDNFYYFCDVAGLEPGAQNLDAYEAEEGFELRIVTIREALETNMRMKTDDAWLHLMEYRENRILNMLTGGENEPTRVFAEFLLTEAAAKNPGPWEAHSYAVARAAEKIALAVQAAGGTSLDPEKAYLYGLLHDIGRQEGYTYLVHVWDGYRFLMSFGFENAARICLTHSFNLQDYDDYIGKRDVSDEAAAQIRTLLESCEYNDYDRLIQVLDSTCGADGTLDLEARMSDVKARYGCYPEGKWNKNFELKEYFEKLMKRPYYEVLRG